MQSDDIPAAPLVEDYSPDQIVLHGIKLNETKDSPSLPFDKMWMYLRVEKGGKTLPIDQVAIAVIYGYAFEGHCYRLDKPRLMVFEHTATEDAEGCGFDKPYKMWRIGSKRMLMELNTSVGPAETLVLEANKPGNRAPNTYGDHMQLAHRGGRLNRTSGSS
jgi:hypothetical protein